MEQIANRGDYLRGTASINEEIKHIIEISSKINLSAINAMLVARRAGDKSLGYSVVSFDLRKFSQQLDLNMNDIRHIIADLIQTVATLLGKYRDHSLLIRTADRSELSRKNIAKSLLAKDKDVIDTKNIISAQSDILRNKLDASLKLCHKGASLARSAKIESAYGGNMSRVLTQVSQEVEDRMSELLRVLRIINTKLNVWQA